MDGPTVNWKVLEMLDVYLEEKDVSKTVNIGSCSQHVVHGALKTGTSNTELVQANTHRSATLN